MATSIYPVRVDARLDAHLSRWLWLVKWVLVIPHLLVLTALWVAFSVVSVIAFFAIAVTGRYPPALFDFNVGVLRWTWRVYYYSFGALATDQYPPFTLEDRLDYPARLEIAYPDHLSRGLVWIKWWLLAIPHYLILGVFVGGTWAAWRFGSTDLRWAPGGLLGLLVFIAAVALLFTGRYPRPIFDLVLGVNRWVLRVAAYAALMTDDYPPFRLDMGGHEPSPTVTLPAPPPPEPEQPGGWGPPPPAARPGGWTATRIVSLVSGCLLALVAFGLLVGAGVSTWADNTQRDAAGYITTGPHSFSVGSYALTSGKIDLGSGANSWTPADLLGTVRLRVTPIDSRAPVFVGVAPQAAVDRYLKGVTHDEVTDWANGHTTIRPATGAVPPSPPAAAGIWTAQSSGPGTRTVTWKPTSGHWSVVVMNAGAGPGLAVRADAGATLPDLGWIAGGLFAAGALVLAVAGALILVPILRASRSERSAR